MGGTVKNIRIAIQVKKTVDLDGKEVWKASAPLNLVFQEDFDAGWLQNELQQFEEKYTELLTVLREILRQIQSTPKNSNAMLYWKLGDEIYRMTEQSDNGVLFLANVNKHLTRDLGISERTLYRCRKFRILYPDNSIIEPVRSFNSYVSSYEKR